MSEEKIAEVLNFMKRRFSKDCDWTNGNCFWFASILNARFKFLSIYYLPVTGHFVAGALGTYFDWTGKIEINEPAYLLNELCENDNEWGRRLLRDCIL